MHIYQKKFARPTRPATALQITSREAVEKAGIEEDSTSSPSPPPRKVLWNLTCPICSHSRRSSHFPWTALDHADVQAVRHLAGKGHATERSYQWRLSSRHSFKGSRRCISAEKIAEIHFSTAVGRTGVNANFLGNDCKRTVPKFTQSRATPVRFT